MLEISDLGRRGLYYLCSENKGADQLCGYRTADLRLCFRIGTNSVFSIRGSNILIQSPTITGGSPSTSIDNETPGGTALPHTFTCTDSDDTLLVAINPANAEFTIDSSAAPSKSLTISRIILLMNYEIEPLSSRKQVRITNTPLHPIFI